ncbi:MAG: large conductance mechanosensitive channel protein MscL [Pseudomonadota bacterium]|nr:large conductance mechanosensitive channel protein MscL [Pseudomonadota bacterium]
MGMVQEFKEFALKGNVMDLAVGVIIGAAFGKITSSLVDDVVMPIIAWILGGDVDFSNMYVVLGEVPEGTANTYAALKEAGVAVLAYGQFLTVLINFILLAFVVFLMVKGINSMRRKEEAAAPATPAADPADIALLKEIRDELRRKSV